ncbi:MAG: NADH-ubiquinone oxidoreductase-F iron-sulfur binding region domain-containing protein [Promethearchaeota archaeon]
MTEKISRKKGTTKKTRSTNINEIDKNTNNKNANSKNTNNKIANSKNANSKNTINKKAITLTQDQYRKAKHIQNSKPIIFIGMGTCGLASGAQATFDTFRSEALKYKLDIEIIPVGCVGSCFLEPIVDIKLPGKARVAYKQITSDKVVEIIQRTLQKEEIIREWVLGKYPVEPSSSDEDFSDIPLISDFEFFKNQKKFVLSRCGVVNPRSFEEYIAYEDGFKALAEVLEEANPQKVIDDIKTSGLRGRGGGGFPTGQKWQFCRDAQSPDGQKYVICNADEGDPGAFMDRAVLESDPFSVIEGMIIMGYAIGASKGIIYCRAEYPIAIKQLTNAISICSERGLLGKNILNSGFNFEIEIKKGAGAFVCGEETALIESIEGKRGMPRIKPPYPATYGLYGNPTNINNVETIAQIAKILNYGPAKFAEWGINKSRGTKVFSLTGKIKHAGLVEVPMGITIREIVKIGGGIPNGKKFKAAQIGGPSGGCIPAHLINTPIDYEELKEVGAMMGSGGLVIMDESTCMVDTARFFMKFIQEESCGKCIPCREGTRRLLEILTKLTQKPKNDYEVVDRMKSMISLKELAYVIKDTALCGLGNSAPNPVLTTLNYFRDEYEAHLYENRCPAKACIGLLSFRIDAEKCVGCGLCKLNCPNDAILGEKKQAHYIVEEKCVKCGLCKSNCKFNAVILE